VRGIAELNGISRRRRVVTIGAATRHADVATNADVKAHIPALAALAGGIGDPAVRPWARSAARSPTTTRRRTTRRRLLGLGATIVTSKREIAADDYFEGMFATALEEDEIITAVRFPVPSRAGYAKFRNPASLYAMAGVFVAETGAACASR
jgi:carbon-monoxide dehydrogenase medium subunit